MNRSYRSYQEGEKVEYEAMTIKEAKDYLVLKGQMVEENERQNIRSEKETDCI
jgi:hypothetical protein